VGVSWRNTTGYVLTMIRAFLDSSVFFSACLSPRGASYAILLESIRGNVSLVISDDVLVETERNLAESVPHVLPAFHEFLEAIAFDVVNPTPQQVAAAKTYTYPKDAPIVAAAKNAKVEYLASLDRKHLVGVAEVSQRSGLTIVLPDVLLAALRKQAAA
jgi:predicted nucleic acid-binding protein